MTLQPKPLEAFVDVLEVEVVVEQGFELGAGEVTGDGGVFREDVEVRRPLLHERMALDWTILYASWRFIPFSISASSTRCENGSPYDASMFSRIRSG